MIAASESKQDFLDYQSTVKTATYHSLAELDDTMYYLRELYKK